MKICLFSLSLLFFNFTVPEGKLVCSNNNSQRHSSHLASNTSDSILYGVIHHRQKEDNIAKSGGK